MNINDELSTEFKKQKFYDFFFTAYTQNEKKIKKYCITFLGI